MLMLVVVVGLVRALPIVLDGLLWRLSFIGSACCLLVRSTTLDWSVLLNVLLK